MKKFDIKKLLILVLALVMVFALVACNKDVKPDDDEGDDPTPTPTPTSTGKIIYAAEYFDALWAASATLGSQPFAEDDSMALSLDLDVMLALGEEVDGEYVKDVFDLGVAIGAVLDATGANTAAKVKLYDKEAGANWLTIYYFVNDQDNLYVEAYDQKLCIPTALTKWAGEDEAFVGNLLQGLLTDKLLGGEKDKDGNVVKEPTTSITELINTIKTAGGDKWTIDNMLFPILDTFGLNLGELLGSVGGFLGIEVPDEGITTLLPVLEELGGALFDDYKKDKKTGKESGACTREAIDGGYCYTGKISGIVGGMLPGIVEGFVGDLLDSENAEIKLIFNTIEDENKKFNKDGVKGIDGFKILVESEGATVANGKDVTVQIGINEVKIENFGKSVDAAKAKEFLGFAGEFSKEFNINLTLDLEIANDALVINPEIKETTVDGKTTYSNIKDAPQYNFNGKYQLALNARIDLANAINTKADIALKVGDNALITVAFVPQDVEANLSQIVVKVDNSIVIDEVPVAATLISMFAPMGIAALENSGSELLAGAAPILEDALFNEGVYDANFEGVVIQNINLDEVIAGLISKLLASVASASAEESGIQANVPNIITAVLNAISFENGIEVKVGNVLNVMAEVIDGWEYAKDGKGVIQEDKDGNPIKNIIDLKADDVLANIGVFEGLQNWWNAFFAGSKWVKATEVETLTNLFKSAAEVSISIGDVAKIAAKVTTPDGASVAATISLSGKANSTYAYNAIGEIPELEGADGVKTVESKVWALLSIPMGTPVEE